MQRFISALLLLFIGFSLQAQTARGVLNTMFKTIEQAKAHSFKMEMEERMEGTMVKTSMLCKVQYAPFRAYIKNLTGKNEGVEVLYVQGERNNKALVNKMMGVKLSPFNKMIRADQHNTILSLGFKTPYYILKDAIKRADERDGFDQVFTLEGTVQFGGRPCYKLVINDPTYEWVSYTIKEGESLYDIAKRFWVSEYLIVQKNGFRNFNQGDAGETIQIPSSYAKKSIIYIDKQNNLPVYQEMHDEKGVFEIYKYYLVRQNPNFTSSDWSEDNPTYNF